MPAVFLVLEPRPTNPVDDEDEDEAHCAWRVDQRLMN
jgi:hypothetical protein